MAGLVCACSSSSPSSSSSEAAGGSQGGSGGQGGVPIADVLGRVFERTPNEGPPVDVPLRGLEPGATTLTGASVRVFTCGSEGDLFCEDAAEQLAVADADGNFLYDPVLDPAQGHGPAAEVNTYYHVERFLDRFGALGFAGVPAPVNVIVGIDPSWGLLAGATDVLGSAGLLVSSAGDRNLAFDPDVYGHELAHVVLGYASRAMDYTLVSTGMRMDAGALTEGSADYFSCAFMGDPDVGEYSAAGLGAPFFSTVENGSRCPDDLFGESHHDGQIWSAALWQIRQTLDGEIVDEAVYDALATAAAGSTMTELANTVRTALARRATPAELAAVDAILEERGLAACEPIVDLVTSRELFVLSGALEKIDPDTGDELPLYETPSALQLRVTVPVTATRLTLTLSAEELALDDVTAQLRYRLPVAYAYDGALTTVADSSHPTTAPIVLDPVPPGELYISLLNSGLADGTVTLEATIE